MIWINKNEKNGGRLTTIFLYVEYENDLEKV